MENTPKEPMRRLLHELLPQQDSKKVYIVSGPPGSGKSTYVSKAKSKGDLVLDMDRLTAALQGEDSLHPSDYKSTFDAAMAAREAIYSVIKGRQGEWKQAFVITSSPRKEKVQLLAARLGGEIVPMQTSKDECIRRIENDPSRTNLERDKQLVGKYFDI